MTHALNLALLLPDPTGPGPAAGDTIVVTNPPANPGDPPETGYASASGGGGGSLPTASRQGQLLVAGASPGFNWAAGDADEGRF